MNTNPIEEGATTHVTKPRTRIELIGVILEGDQRFGRMLGVHLMLGGKGLKDLQKDGKILRIAIEKMSIRRLRASCVEKDKWMSKCCGREGPLM